MPSTKSGEIPISRLCIKGISGAHKWLETQWSRLFSSSLCRPHLAPPCKGTKTSSPLKAFVLVSPWAYKWAVRSGGGGRTEEFRVCVPHFSRSTAVEARAGQQPLQQRTPNERLRQPIIKPYFAVAPAVNLNCNYVQMFPTQKSNNNSK